MAQSYWGAIFQLGCDPVTQQVSDNLALRRIDRIYKLSARVSDHLEIDPDLEFKIRDLHSRITALDVANLYDILPVTSEDGLWRAIGIRGRSQSDIYQLSMINPDLDGWLKSAGGTDTRFTSGNDRIGNLHLGAFVKPNPNDAYRLAAEAQIYLDDISARTVPRIIDGILAAVWTQAVGDTRSTIKGRNNSSLNRQSMSVLESLTLEFPDLIRFLLTYFAIDSIISSNPNGIGDSVLLDIRAQFKPEAFLRDFPEIKKLLDEVKGMIFFRALIHDEQDRLMGLLELDPVDNIFTTQLRILNGQLLPLNIKMGEESKNSMSLTAPGCKQLYIAYDMHLNMVGLLLKIDSLQIGLELNNRDQELDYTACLWQLPETVKAGGWAFGFIPLWLVDALIPSNVEEITRNFFQTLALGNDGQGTTINIESFGARESANKVLVLADSEILANGTIKYAFNLQRKLLARQQALLQEFRTFNRHLLDSFYRDYQRVKARRNANEKF